MLFITFLMGSWRIFFPIISHSMPFLSTLLWIFIISFRFKLLYHSFYFFNFSQLLFFQWLNIFISIFFSIFSIDMPICYWSISLFYLIIINIIVFPLNIIFHFFLLNSFYFLLLFYFWFFFMVWKLLEFLFHFWAYYQSRNIFRALMGIFSICCLICNFRNRREIIYFIKARLIWYKWLSTWRLACFLWVRNWFGSRSRCLCPRSQKYTSTF